jgi:5-methylcytosine-specific restriction endonuclease McrA
MPGEQHNCTVLQADSRRRQARRRAHGRTTSRWQSLRKLALERDGYVCQLQVDAGCTGVATSVHLRPELDGNHDAATLDDCTSGCAHCHGVVDGRRGVGQYAIDSTRPAPRAARISHTHAQAGA